MKTIDYANSELKKYYFLVTGSENCEITLRCTNEGNPFDDRFEVSVSAGRGTITGNSERAVLLGVYKFFYELGCRFIRPGKNGEILVKKKGEECNVHKTYTPRYRYRGVCSEGAISEENIVDMVEWLPKVGMNSYFMQFVNGHLFFEKWYTHKNSSVLKAEPYNVAQSVRHFENAVKAIKRCGLIYQAVGHGWTTDPLGYVTYGDTRSQEEDIKPEHRKLFALVNGKRGFFNGPGDTHLCYSNPDARNTLTDGIVNYLRAHSEVDVLHFWLADSINNHCECEACSKRLPSEWYVTMLNELDEKLTAQNIQTKIVFLIYCDLLFAPKDVKINNPDRFILMYAPISRDFFHPLYTEENLAAAGAAPEYVRNKNDHPKTGGQFLHYLLEWQKVIKCDSFAFDYHLMTFQYGGEPSFTRISRTLYDDMEALGDVGLNGNVSCQLQRTFLPTALPNYVMAERLFGSGRSFEEIEDECLRASFGRQTDKIKEFLHTTEAFFLTDFMCGKDEAGKHLGEIKDYCSLLEDTKSRLEFTDKHATVEVSLQNLNYFLTMMQLFMKTFRLKAQGKPYEKEKEELVRFIDEAETSVQPYEDSLFRKDGINGWL